MDEEVFMSAVGSVTVSLLVIATVFLLRSFYKRYTRMQNLGDDSNEQ